MIKKNNSFVSLALGIFFYCNRHNIPTESREVGERTPKSHWNISLESTGFQGSSVVLEPDPEGSAGNKFPVLNLVALGFWALHGHVTRLSQTNLKRRENAAIPPKHIICWPQVITDPPRLVAKQHFCNNWDNETWGQKIALQGRDNPRRTVELQLLRDSSWDPLVLTPPVYFYSNSLISLDSRLVLTLGWFKHLR